MGVSKSERIPGWAQPCTFSWKRLILRGFLTMRGSCRGHFTESLLWNVGGQCLTKEEQREGMNSSGLLLWQWKKLYLICENLVQTSARWNIRISFYLFYYYYLLVFKLLSTTKEDYGAGGWSVLDKMLNLSDFPRLNQAPEREQCSLCCSALQTLKEQNFAECLFWSKVRRRWRETKMKKT